MESIVKDIEKRSNSCCKKLNTLEQVKDEIEFIKKKILDSSVNFNKTINSQREEFNSIEVYNDHLEALKNHVSNTHDFLNKQQEAVQLHLQQN